MTTIRGKREEYYVWRYDDLNDLVLVKSSDYDGDDVALAHFQVAQRDEMSGKYDL